MARKDYIEKINQNLEHLTKDELKDVSILTTAQYGVRMKVAEKEYIEKEIANLTPQLQQQALPVVPEFVAEWIEILKTKGLKPLKNPETYGETGFTEEKLQNIVFWISEHQEDYMRAWLDGYTVEKPQMFEVKMPIVYWDDDASQLTNGFDFLRIDKETDEVDFVGFLSNTKKHTVHFTEQEIKSIDERYWQFAVPVEDGE
ncbi:DUF1642 domain-containing protein [Lactococcus cremoris]|uniref:DUF1642 domain-containing protein n=1 Tax=Lactococcus lactis subsp. cremoris TaxID=1359 RepID=UPI00215D9C1A|nr:DUF1642 domain-containing protein [Lactococcus cremoris]